MQPTKSVSTLRLHVRHRHIVVVAAVALLLLVTSPWGPPAAAAASPAVTVCPDGSSGSSFPAGTVIKGDLVVPTFGVCYLAGTTVSGDVRADPGADSLVAYGGALIKGDVTVGGLRSVVFQGVTVRGDIRLQGITDIAQICCESVLGGQVRVTASNVVTLFSVRASGNVTLNDNATVITYDSQIRGDLTCRRNDSVSSGEPPDTVRGENRGQCSGLDSGA